MHQFKILDKIQQQQQQQMEKQRQRQRPEKPNARKFSNKIHKHESAIMYWQNDRHTQFREQSFSLTLYIFLTELHKRSKAHRTHRKKAEKKQNSF